VKSSRDAVQALVFDPALSKGSVIYTCLEAAMARLQHAGRVRALVSGAARQSRIPFSFFVCSSYLAPLLYTAKQRNLQNHLLGFEQ